MAQPFPFLLIKLITILILTSHVFGDNTTVYSTTKSPATSTETIQSNTTASPIATTMSKQFKIVTDKVIKSFENMKKTKKSCPAPCSCPTEDTLDCSSRNLTEMVNITNFNATNNNIRSINLSNNTLKTFDSKLPQKLKLDKLDLSHNNITNFQLKQSVNNLDLSHNQISSLSSSMISDKTTLRKIDLSYNHITSIPELFFPNFTNLIELDLSGNNLSSLNVTFVEWQTNSSISINLSQNPWHCDCESLWLKKIVHNLGLVGNMHCASPEIFKDTEVAFYLKDCPTTEQANPNVPADMKLVSILIVILAASLIIGSLMAVKHNSFCRRIIGREQYSSVYYTKAEFGPMDTL